MGWGLGAGGWEASERYFSSSNRVRDRLPRGCTVPEPASERVHRTGASFREGAPHRGFQGCTVPEPASENPEFCLSILATRFAGGCGTGVPPSDSPRGVLNLEKILFFAHFHIPRKAIQNVQEYRRRQVEFTNFCMSCPNAQSGVH